MRTSQNAVKAKFGTARDHTGAGNTKAGPLSGGGGRVGARLEYWSDCSAGSWRSIYAIQRIFVYQLATILDELLGETLLRGWLNRVRSKQGASCPPAAAWLMI